jgi:hypothetical protein
MTKMWIAVLAALGLNGALLHAAEPAVFKDLPPAEIKRDTPPPDPKPAPAPPPAPAPGPCAAPPACAPACKPSECGGLLGLNLHLGQGCRCGDHAQLAKLWAWATYRPCHLASLSCCGRLLPVPYGYEFFLYPGCAEGPGGSCCKSSCNGCNGCGGK